ncbi:AAA family ATPase [Pseudoduganella sp. RAF53_2]|uniref:AAA family ATPase n=1 Tax=unclassified Pseudoduganella TaxID=2637179 RepID=UPI003F9B365A
MKKGFVQNSNYARFVQTVKATEQRGAREASMMLVTGPAGLGKSATVDRYAVDTSALYLRGKETWTKRALLMELAELLRIPTNATNHALQAKIIGAIGARQTPIIIDEAEHTVSRSASILECIRDISDLTETLIVLVGMESMESMIARHPQISSRIAAVARFEALTVQDVQLACKQLSEFPMDAELVQELHRQSAGKMRLVMNGIANIERVAKTNGLTSATFEAMRGVELCIEWQARRPRVGGAR